jgi:mevalonate kinase
MSGVTATAPGRVCLAGESLDWLIGGPSVTLAIPLYTTVTVHRGFESTVSVGPPFPPRTSTVLSGPLRVRDPLSYLRAAVRVSSGVDGVGGVQVRSTTRLPTSGGVSSSAAVMLAATGALLALRGGANPPRPQVCAAAYEAEVGQLCTGAGWMDFLACAYGGIASIDAGTATVQPLRTDLGATVVLVDTRESRATAETLRTKRERAAAGDPTVKEYVARATRTVAELATCLHASTVDLAAVGALLTEAHGLLRDQMGCSTALIEACVAATLRAGAYGAKLTGSGHGGCLFALAAPDDADRVRAALAGLPVRTWLLPQPDQNGLAITSA